MRVRHTVRTGAESRPPGGWAQPRRARDPSATQAEGPVQAAAVGQGPRRGARRVQPGRDTTGRQGRSGPGAGGSNAGVWTTHDAPRGAEGGTNAARTHLRSSRPTQQRSSKMSTNLDTPPERDARRSFTPRQRKPKTPTPNRAWQPTARETQRQVELAAEALRGGLTREQVITALIGH